jgi:hypothetical protein
MIKAKIECSICKTEKIHDMNYDNFEIYNFNICPQKKCRESHYLCNKCFYSIIKLDYNDYIHESLLDIEKKIVYICPFDRIEFELNQEAHFKLLWKMISKHKKI